MLSNNLLQFKWLGIQGEETPLPSKAHNTDIGYDLYLYKFEKNILHNELPGLVIGEMWSFGYGVKFPPGYYGAIFPRSSIGKTFFSLANSVGIIDPDYRGELKVIIRKETNTINLLDEFKSLGTNINPDKKLFQLILLPISPNFNVQICSDDDWNETIRSDGGFGSTNNILTKITN